MPRSYITSAKTMTKRSDYDWRVSLQLDPNIAAAAGAYATFLQNIRRDYGTGPKNTTTNHLSSIQTMHGSFATRYGNFVGSCAKGL